MTLEKAPLHTKAIELGFPYVKLYGKFEFKIGEMVNSAIYPIQDIIDQGVLIGKTDNLHLIEWDNVTDITT